MLPHIANLNGIVFYYNCSKFGFRQKFMFRAIVDRTAKLNFIQGFVW